MLLRNNNIIYNSLYIIFLLENISNFITIDINCNIVLFSYLYLKKYRFIGEESTAMGEKVELTNAPTWIIDPIDGTMNFVHGLPHTCISVALLINKTTEIGIVYNPVLEQLFTARKGQGAFLNGAPIHVSDKKGNLLFISKNANH